MGENALPIPPVFSTVKPACFMSCSGKLSQEIPGVSGLDLSQQGDKAVSQGLPPAHHHQPLWGHTEALYLPREGGTPAARDGTLAIGLERAN